MKIKDITFIIIFISAILSCTGTGKLSDQEDGDTVSLKYAQLVNAVKYKDYTIIDIKNPWHEGKNLRRYVLVPASKKLPASLPDDGIIIRTPVKRTLITTSVHCSLLKELQRENTIAGVCDIQYINLPWIKEWHKEGKIKDCGSTLSPTIENIIEMNPDAILLSPFQNNGGYGRVESLGVPIIEAADYMETSALGRAEWMKIYGMFWETENIADTLFANVEKEYHRLKDIAAKQTNNPSIMLDTQTGSVWYIPGGSSTIGKVIADAGIRYAYSNVNKNGSLALSYEKVLDSFSEADIWMLKYNSPYNMTLSSLAAENYGCNNFNAYKKGNVYACNTAVSTYYEETPFHPERLLKEHIIIAFPHLNLGDTKYFKKLK